MTPEKYKFIKPIDTTILKMKPEVDPDMALYTNELLEKDKQSRKSEQ